MSDEKLLPPLDYGSTAPGGGSSGSRSSDDGPHKDGGEHAVTYLEAQAPPPAPHLPAIVMGGGGVSVPVYLEATESYRSPYFVWFTQTLERQLALEWYFRWAMHGLHLALAALLGAAGFMTLAFYLVLWNLEHNDDGGRRVPFDAVVPLVAFIGCFAALLFLAVVYLPTAVGDASLAQHRLRYLLRWLYFALSCAVFTGFVIHAVYVTRSTMSASETNPNYYYYYYYPNAVSVSMRPAVLVLCPLASLTWFGALSMTLIYQCAFPVPRGVQGL